MQEKELIVMEGFTKKVLRVKSPNGGFLNLDDDYDPDGINWDVVREELITYLVENYGQDWAGNGLEIQVWEISEKRIS